MVPEKADALLRFKRGGHESAKTLRQLSRRLTQRQRLLLLLAVCLTVVLAINMLRRRPPPGPLPGHLHGLPQLGPQSMTFYDQGMVDGDFVGWSPHLRVATEEAPIPKSWEWLDDEQEAPRRALLTPEYLLDENKSGIGAPKPDAATVGKHVRVLWIGDLGQAPDLILKYVERGFNVTVHTSVDRILDGFVPHVRRAFERAIPRVAGFDFLKLLLLYKHGGLVVDADTCPVVNATDVALPGGCDVLFGKENHLEPEQFARPIYRREGGPKYMFNRPFQLLNWAMLAVEPRNRHIEELIMAAMRHFFGLRDMELLLVQDVAGSGLITDYVALLHEQHGVDFVATYNDRTLVRPIEGLCMLEDELRGRWIAHAHMATWHAEN